MVAASAHQMDVGVELVEDVLEILHLLFLLVLVPRKGVDQVPAHDDEDRQRPHLIDDPHGLPRKLQLPVVRLLGRNGLTFR